MTATSANRRLAAGAKQDTAEVLVRPFPATRGRADGLVGEPLPARVGWWWWPGLWWPESSPATTLAAAGARVSSGRGYGERGGACEASTGSTRSGDQAGHDGRAVVWPRTRRRRAQAAARAGGPGAAATACERGSGEGKLGQELTVVATR